MTTPAHDDGADWSGRRGARTPRGPRAPRGGAPWDGKWNGPGRGWPGELRWVGDWSGPGPERHSDVPQKPVRIGDAERDQAVSQLSEHFVAGRITQAEFEERSEQASQARYVADLVPLFDDLPQEQPQPAAVVRRRPSGPPPFMMLLPFLMVGLVISSIALAAPWLLWGVFWVVIISGMSRRRWSHYRR
ncbi:DUF1707 domain-containing protein [Kribbella sp. NPDC026611]|uniref:DUF1707 SHOCT-like domain-containing protein n=1 Tax=Kribbella sp. NPDC026611 TaxID=3154911 RepID=UPI0033BFDFBA